MSGAWWYYGRNAIGCSENILQTGSSLRSNTNATTIQCRFDRKRCAVTSWRQHKLIGRLDENPAHKTHGNKQTVIVEKSINCLHILMIQFDVVVVVVSVHLVGITEWLIIIRFGGSAAAVRILAPAATVQILCVCRCCCRWRCTIGCDRCASNRWATHRGAAVVQDQACWCLCIGEREWW